jgi:hypothetical protein
MNWVLHVTMCPELLLNIHVAEEPLFWIQLGSMGAEQAAI